MSGRKRSDRPGRRAMTAAELQAHLDLRRGSRTSRHTVAWRKGSRGARKSAAIKADLAASR